MSTHVPVLLIGFNRLETFQQTLPRLREAAPQRIYLACDGPRTLDEQVRTDAVRTFLLDQIDWPADIFMLFQEQNLGCGKAVSTAINWFFAHEEQGIILEDDCLVSPSFFKFAEEMLDLYHDNEQIMHIGAANLYPETTKTTDSYVFSPVSHIWGWATWRRAWQHYDVNNLNVIRNSNFFAEQGLSAHSQASWVNMFQKVAQGQVDTWDHQWLATLWRHQGLAVIPAENMIRNVGFGQDATHTTDIYDSNARLIAQDMAWPLQHPSVMTGNIGYLQRFLYVEKQTLLKRIIRRIKNKVVRHV